MSGHQYAHTISGAIPMATYDGFFDATRCSIRSPESWRTGLDSVVASPDLSRSIFSAFRPDKRWNNLGVNGTLLKLAGRKLERVVKPWKFDWYTGVHCGEDAQ